MTKQKTLKQLVEEVMKELSEKALLPSDRRDILESVLEGKKLKGTRRVWISAEPLFEEIKNALFKIAKATAEAGRVEEKDLDDVEFNLEKYLTGRKWSEITSGKIKDIIYSAGQKSGFNQAIQEQQQKLKSFLEGRKDV